MDSTEVVVPYVTAGLTDADVEFGRRLWTAFHASEEFPISGMLWLFEGEWHLMIASPIVDQLGPRDAFIRLAEKARPIQSDQSRLLRVQLVSPRIPLYEALRAIFGKAASVEGMRLGGSQVGGIYIEDAYVYGIR